MGVQAFQIFRNWLHLFSRPAPLRPRRKVWSQSCTHVMYVQKTREKWHQHLVASILQNLCKTNRSQQRFILHLGKRLVLAIRVWKQPASLGLLLSAQTTVMHFGAKSTV